MLETVMALPFLAVIIGLTFFFGWSLRNQQQVHAADRYLTWRDVRGASWRADEDLNKFMFMGLAGGIGTDRGGGAGRAREDLVEKTDQKSARAGNMLAEHAVNRWPDGASTNLSVDFPTEVGMWRWFRGNIVHRHSREGVEWVRGQVSYLETIRDQFLFDLHNAVCNIPDATLQANLKALYLQQW